MEVIRLTEAQLTSLIKECAIECLKEDAFGKNNNLWNRLTNYSKVQAGQKSFREILAKVEYYCRIIKANNPVLQNIEKEERSKIATSIENVYWSCQQLLSLPVPGFVNRLKEKLQQYNTLKTHIPIDMLMKGDDVSDKMLKTYVHRYVTATNEFLAMLEELNYKSRDSKIWK